MSTTIKYDETEPWEFRFGLWVRVLAFVRLTWPMFHLLGVGFGWVVLSCRLTRFNFPASGAVLVCCCIISDLWFQVCRWRNVISKFRHHYIFEFKAEKQENIHRIYGYRTSPENQKAAFHASGIEKKNDAVYLLRRLSRISHYTTDQHHWNIHATAVVLERIIVVIVAFSAVIGTFVWGYGDASFLSCCK